MIWHVLDNLNKMGFDSKLGILKIGHFKRVGT